MSRRHETRRSRVAREQWHELLQHAELRRRTARRGQQALQ